VSNKKFGLGKERELKKLLKDEGAIEVCRARGSFGNFDILAFYRDHCLLISVKSTKQKYASYLPEAKRLIDINVPGYCRKQLRIWWSPHKDRKKKGWEIIHIG